MRALAAAVAITAALALVFAAPSALAHGDEDHSSSDDADRPDGPFPHPSGHDRFLGQQWWGDVTTIPTPQGTPTDPAISSGWLVWTSQNASGDNIVAYNLSQDVRVQVTDDGYDQFEPAVVGSQVVWIERVQTTYKVRTYNLHTGEGRVVEKTSNYVRDVTISSDWIAWEVFVEDEPGSADSWDIYAYDRDRGAKFGVATDRETDVDPVIVGDHVSWRRREYSQWDVWVIDLTDVEASRVTADVQQERYLRAGEDSFVYTQEHRDRTGFHGYRYFPESGRTVDLGFDPPSRTGAWPAPNGLILQDPYVTNTSLTYRLDDTGAAYDLHTGRVDVQEMTIPTDRHMGIVVGDGDQRKLAHFRYSPLAQEPPPEITIESPTESARVSNLTTVEGTVEVGDWPAPSEVLVSLDTGRRWVPADGTTTWQVTIDLSEVNVGRHVIRVGANFPDGPPQQDKVRVVVGQPLDFTKDLTPRLEGQSRSLAAAVLDTIPLLVVLILALLAVLLLLVRTYLRWERERNPEARYVAPEEPPPPHDNPAEAAGREAGDPATGSGSETGPRT